MLTLIERICERLQKGAYVNEAAISHGVVTPVLAALGWDSADPDQLVPEYRVENGFVDFALFGRAKKAVIFIEVKGLGKAADGDRQLFSYAFHHGVPLVVLTDGREWSFYLPAGEGSYEDRRLYRLQLDERSPAEVTSILERYLGRERVRDGSAFDDARRDHQSAVGRKEAASTLPRAWTELMNEAHELIVETLANKAEALCGYAPDPAAAEAFLRSLKQSGAALPPAKSSTASKPQTAAEPATDPTASSERSVTFQLFGKSYTTPNAGKALVEILRTLSERDPSRLPALAAAVKTPKLAHVGRSAEEINPGNPSLARPAEIGAGWSVNLTISNRTKMDIIRAAAEVWELRFPQDLQIDLPNA